MMKTLKTTALAAVLVSASMPASSIVIGGDQGGWELSFSGTINLFMNFYDIEGGDKEVHLQEGLLPAFATFKAKSPVMNGMTSTAQISFAPDSSNSKLRRADKGGSAVDIREVFLDIEGDFGTFSAGRTLGIFSRQAILKDQTLYGVGAGAASDGGGTTLGRIAHGYVYPAFDTRFSYKTPDMNGFQLELGLYDPLEGNEGEDSLTWKTATPRIETELVYGTSFVGDGNLNFWLGGLWQDSEDVTNTFAVGGMRDLTHWGVDVGAQATLNGFELVGHYTKGENLGQKFKIATPVFGLEDTEEEHWYAQAGYTFAGRTKVAFSYGESEQEDNGVNAVNDLWTVGVYHDIASWLKVVAEYNDTENVVNNTSGATFIDDNGNLALLPSTDVEAQVFSVGAFIFW